GREALVAAAAESAAPSVAAQDLPASMHVLTHRDLHLHPVLVACGDEHARVVRESGEGGWFTASQWTALGLPAPIRKLLDALPPV
ncbi:MAG: A/G-specific adenine glycosylase, partial [Comamonadaceae bacterium]